MRFTERISAQRSTTAAPRNRKSLERKEPGRIIGTIAVQPEVPHKSGFNPLQVFWSIDKTRKDYNEVVTAGERFSGRLPGYNGQLIDSCFKNWRDA